MDRKPKVQWRTKPDSEAWYVEGKTTDKGTIVLYKDRATKLTEEHERAHYQLGHYKNKAVTPRRLVAREITAELTTFKKIGKPLSIKRPMCGVVKELQEYWGMTRKEAVEIVKDVAKGYKIPKIWYKGMASI